MLKKAGIAAAVAVAGLVAVAPFAFADDSGALNGAHGQIGLVNVQDSAAQVPIQACNNSVIEGTAGFLAKHQENSDSHDGKCRQKNSWEDDAGSR